MTRVIVSALFVALVALAALAACAAPTATTSAPSPEDASAANSSANQAADYPLSEAPAELKPAIERAEAAIKSLKGALGGRLMAEMKAGGPAKAISVCRDEATTITASISGDVRIGRTAARLRNPKNSAPAWLAGMVEKTATAKASEVQPRVYDLGDKIGVVKPIGTVGVCLDCHGAPESIDATVNETLAASYPNDQATGFQSGDLRGLFWVETSK